MYLKKITSCNKIIQQLPIRILICEISAFGSVTIIPRLLARPVFCVLADEHIELVIELYVDIFESVIP